jgi:hypothetical protein
MSSLVSRLAATARGALALAAVAGCAEAPHRDPTLLDRAIAAAGGEAALSRVRGLQWSSKGEIFEDDKASPYVAQWAFALPLSFRWTFESDGARHVEAFDGTTSWGDDGSGPAALAGDRARGVAEMAIDNRVSLLVPLRSSDFAVEERGSGEVRGRPALALHVDCAAREYHRTLWFDRDTMLLAKTEGPTAVPVNGSSNLEIYLSEYRDVGGVQYPFHSEVWFAGKRVVADSLVELRLEPPAADVFAAPVKP